MKKWLLLPAVLLFLSGCSAGQRTDITPEEIVAAYEDAGYSVWFEYYDEKLDEGQIGSIQADHPNGDYIFFDIFEKEEEAKAFKKEFYHPVTISLFSAIYGDPSWIRWEVNGCIVAQYDDPELFEIFQELMRSK